ncbi:MAG: phage tail sheath family protein [Cyanobacteria bacterium RU_5_0]|nr:phage tail sheath family protein [Cyanobacteria bacterium RU_5_0]
MPQYLSPGVYVEEVASAIQAIAGVGTSTAGFIGLVADTATMPLRPGVTPANPPAPTDLYPLAPANVPQLVTTWSEFKSKFGDVQDGNRVLGNAVYGFFNNGGTRCWVTRVADLNDATSDSGTPVPATDTPAPSASGTASPVDAVQKALEGFEAIDEIAIVAVPMMTGSVPERSRRVAIREMVLSHCERMQDRFAILDGEETVAGNLTPANIYPSATGDALGSRSTYGAVYFPYIDISGNQDYMPPSGHIAGIYARVDASRGVHKAPANETIRGVLGLKYRVSRIQQDGLNPQGINIVRELDGSPTVWGARTIGGDANTEFKYINVRRTFNFLRESIDEGTQWAVFEPNTPALWQQITRNLTAFLTNIWRSGALFGNTPEEAFYVKCDAETNPPEVRELGQVVTEIGVAIVRPAEFVIFRVSQFTAPS